MYGYDDRVLITGTCAVQTDRFVVVSETPKMELISEQGWGGICETIRWIRGNGLI